MVYNPPRNEYKRNSNNNEHYSRRLFILHATIPPMGNCRTYKRNNDDPTQPSAGVFGVESGFENVMRCCVVSVRRSNDNESADVICDSARYCCSCFVTGSCVNFICIGGLWGSACCNSLGMTAL